MHSPKQYHTPLSLSQNFIRSPQLIEKILKKSSLPRKFPIVDIGAGKGMITRALLPEFEKIVAIEPDKQLFEMLEKEFQGRVNVVKGDVRFMKIPLYEKYSMIGNIPFAYTADIVKKVLFGSSNVQSAVLFMQRDAAYRFLGQPHDKESMQSLRVKFEWNADILHRCKREDFIPQPRVNVVVVEFYRKWQLSLAEARTIDNLLAFMFGGWWKTAAEGFYAFLPKTLINREFSLLKVPLTATIRELPFELWEAIFRLLEKNPASAQKIKGASMVLKSRQDTLQKRHRTTYRPQEKTRDSAKRSFSGKFRPKKSGFSRKSRSPR